ncbi:7,8-didemethyl-8-hydroxy-5-deazariboflavin synthase [Frankia sp. B2]|uniref:bifunctional FO biosynthesis protein CofGH n=1 Tax=Frankia TaxID=1854 RepID=UPI000A0FE60F|nr:MULTISPECIES: bifunctional FO biosynthesis protein CofGH [Frankia]ORT98967.1 7,8-didemethyl-8-hydroxy-5-deazariboflavin synthase [Frankia casuarinae]TFE32427.1 7,8-didemethyl-8-hydroxy-5-deazariboflavin synthase [Frankia sp. B2]
MMSTAATSSGAESSGAESSGAESSSPPSPSALRRALRRARDGATLDVVEATILLAARGDDLADLCRSAAGVRDAGLASIGRPGVVTYSPKVFIPLTRLCRDRCHYCTFATVPHRLPAPYLTVDEVLGIARAGAAAGCAEALFTLGDRPEDRWPAAREWLDAHGYDSTLGYLRAVAIAVLEETGLLPHLNPGVLSWVELARLKPVAPSMGMMLETTATRLWSEPGGAHYGSPDKDPAVRLRVLTDAGRLSIPFTTGLLLGIGETRTERAETIFELRGLARRYGSIQEVIVQNFRAKDDTAMRSAPDVGAEELAAAVAVTRLVLGPTMRVQAPPNLVDTVECALLLSAGIDDWGGVSPVTPDHVNPERPWPDLDVLAAVTAQAGFTLRPRLTVYPSHLGEPWIDPRLAGHVGALAGVDGLLADGVLPVGRPWQEPDGGLADTGRTDLHAAVDTVGRRSEKRADFDTVYGDWESLRAQVSAAGTGVDGVVGTGSRAIASRAGAAAGAGAMRRIDPDMLAALRHAGSDPAGITDAEALTLFGADGAALEELCALADGLRRDVVGEDVTYVVNRNINFTNVCYTGCRFCAFAQRRGDADAYTLSLDEVGSRAAQAWAVGATEVCVQGGIHPDLPGAAYFDLAREIKRQAPGLHLHAYSPMEVLNGVTRTGLSIGDWLTAAREAGVDTIPGTAAEILDDDVRWVLTKGKLPAASWVEVVTTAHRVGLRSSATMMYGHVDTPAHWVAHLRLLRRIQDSTGGFTEFVALPFVHHSSPIYLAGVARPGPTRQENRAVHAMARILLHGSIDNIQCSWVKLGVEGCRAVLTGGANDIGGTLMEETISRMAGSQHGSRRSVAELEEVAAGAGRPARQRTTTYGRIPDERFRAARGRTVRAMLPVVS